MYKLCYSMVCPPIRGENPRALASGLSSVQAEKICFYIPLSE